MALHRSDFRRWLAGIPILSSLIGCAGNTSAPEESVSYPGSFRIKETASTVEAEGTRIIWLATAARGTKSAHFRIELLLKPQKVGQLFDFTKGALIREEESDGTWFLTELSEVLGATIAPQKVSPAARLEFDASVLGTSLTRQSGPDQFAGMFTSNPPGNWIAIKIFVANGDGEFFLNLNSTDGRGEISLKDEDYGDAVVRELATILLPNGSTNKKLPTPRAHARVSMQNREYQATQIMSDSQEEDFNKMAEESLGMLTTLLEIMLDFAKVRLHDRGGFSPFGAMLDSRRELAFLMLEVADDLEGAEQLSRLAACARERVAEEDASAAVLCYDCRVVPPGQVDKSDSVCIHYEDKLGERWDLFFPYAPAEDGGAQYQSWHYEYGEALLAFTTGSSPPITCLVDFTVNPGVAGAW